MARTTKANLSAQIAELKGQLEEANLRRYALESENATLMHDQEQMFEALKALAPDHPLVKHLSRPHGAYT